MVLFGLNSYFQKMSYGILVVHPFQKNRVKLVLKFDGVLLLADCVKLALSFVNLKLKQLNSQGTFRKKFFQIWNLFDPKNNPICGEV